MWQKNRATSLYSGWIQRTPAGVPTPELGLLDHTDNHFPLRHRSISICLSQGA
jgi:hypothetical protein